MITRDLYILEKKRHTVKFLVVSTLSGAIRYVGRIWNGKEHDLRMFRSEPGGISFKGKKVYVVGFFGLSPETIDGELVIPNKKERNKELPQEKKDENKKISSIRVIVENAIGGAKHFYINSIRNRFHFREKTQDYFQLCTALSNLKGNKRKSLVIN